MDGLALVVPTAIGPLDGEGRVDIAVTPTVAGVLTAWETDQQLKAIHEAAHVAAGCLSGISPRSAEIASRFSGHTTFDTGDDDRPMFVRASVHMSRIVVLLAGAAAERLILGEPTTGNSNDVMMATTMAVDRFAEGMDPDAPAGGLSLDAFRTAPESLREVQATSVLRTLTEARDRADVLVAEHRDQIIGLARILLVKRRLANGELDEALRSVGLDPRRGPSGS
jgi:cell division protease FtsH